MQKLAPVIALLLVLAGNPFAFAEDAKPFVAAKDIDLTRILPPPPANDSDKTKAKIVEVLAFQVTRTPEMVARAQADAEEDVWRFADVMGPNSPRKPCRISPPSSTGWWRPKVRSLIRRRITGSGRGRIN